MMFKGFGHNHYVPLLKSKAAEFRSLSDLKEETKPYVTPLIELTPPDYDYENDEPKKEIDIHIRSVIEKLGEAWEDRYFFCDFNNYYLAEIDGEPAARFIDAHLQQNAPLVIPVIVLPHPIIPEICQLIIKMNCAKNNGICLRVFTNDCEPEDLDAHIEMVLAHTGLNPSMIDIILDCGTVGDEYQTISLAMKLFINQLSHLKEWRSLTVAAASFPKDTSEVLQDTKRHFTRSDYLLWKRLNTAPKFPKRRPAFGDYAIAHPELFGGDPRRLNVPVHLRYTLDTEWLVHKKGVVKKGESSNFSTICEDLVATSDFHGEDFSWGDSYIKNCADGNGKTGNATTWRHIGTNHHIEKTVSQLQFDSD